MRDVKAENDHNLKDDVPTSFTGIPADLLIGQPLQAVARGQQELCRTYIQAIKQQALTVDNASKEEQDRNSSSQSSDD
ncbi:hypothetical protein ACTQ4E_12905 [Lawsonibacter sp. LCP25S3_G6]|uniref:hypothetical protein n=1 Tax=unclassified Lawsonibacter TaxID=2617946 RepID=UPI003F9D7747